MSESQRKRSSDPGVGTHTQETEQDRRQCNWRMGQDQRALQGAHDANVHFPHGFSRVTSFNVHHLKLVYYEPHFTDEAAEAPSD